MVKILRIYGALIFMAILALIQAGCHPGNYSKVPAYSTGNYLQAVIEIPAGTSKQISYCMLTHRFRVMADEDSPQKVDFMPYPFNYGFIPSTNFSAHSDGRSLIDIMVISESLETGTLLEVIPLALLILKDDFTTYYKVLAIPASPEKQIIRADMFEDIKIKYASMTDIIEDWFLSSGLYQNPMVAGWEDEHVTRNFIQKHTLTFNAN